MNAHQYGPYRPDEGITPEGLEQWNGHSFDDLEGIPDWLHEQRRQIAEATA